MDLEDDERGMIVQCRRNSGISVRLLNRRLVVDDPDAILYDVALRAPGLCARVDQVVAWKCDGDLDGFLCTLADDFRGWQGERSWCANDRDLEVQAVFHSGGLIALNWTIRPWRRATGRWNASVTTWLEAGEQMAAAAADIRDLFHSDQAG